jgi:hypothetical protein
VGTRPRILRHGLVRFHPPYRLLVRCYPLKRTDELPEVYKRQRDKDRTELEELRAANIALQHQLGSKTNPVLTQVARALLLGALASDPLQAAQLDGNRVMRTTPTYSDPGVATRSAREHTRRLHKNLLDAVARFDTAAEHGWYPPRPEKEPQVRCVNSHCLALGKRLPKHVGPRGTTIELTNCPKCGNRLAAA